LVLQGKRIIQNTKIKVAFVSTNSISQWEQVGILWSVLLEKFHIKIHFAHQTFRWSNDAKGNAAVFCIIIGFASYDTTKKKLYLYEWITGDAHEVVVKNINPYLVDAKDIIISNTKKPICNIPAMMRWSQPTDGGNFIMNQSERDAIISLYPTAYRYILPYIGAEEFINGGERYCLWLVDADPSEIKSIPPIMERVEAVKKFRSESIAATTRDYPFHTLFRQIAQPQSDYILIPRVSSERRPYIPMWFLPKNTITADSCLFVPNATLYHFGILTSQMHMSWVRSTCGRLKSDYRYSKDIVYNNYPWPDASDKNQAKISELAQAVLDARALFPLASLADLYDPRTMPAALVRAHTDLDRAVDRLYRSAGFASDIERVAELFERWERMSGEERRVVWGSK
jgi:hypothetical protein